MNREQFLKAMVFVSAAAVGVPNASAKKLYRYLADENLSIPLSRETAQRYQINRIFTADDLLLRTDEVKTQHYDGFAFPDHGEWMERTGLHDDRLNYRVYRLSGPLIRTPSGDAVPIYENAQTFTGSYYENQNGPNPGML